MTNNKLLRIVTFKDSKESFLSLLIENDIEFSVRHPQPGAVTASGEVVEILQAIGAVSIFPSLAAIIVQWLKYRGSRKVILQTRDQQIFHLEGYSANEVSKLLENAENITVIDTKKPDSTN